MNQFGTSGNSGFFYYNNNNNKKSDHLISVIFFTF